MMMRQEHNLESKLLLPKPPKPSNEEAPFKQRTFLYQWVRRLPFLSPFLHEIKLIDKNSFYEFEAVRFKFF